MGAYRVDVNTPPTVARLMDLDESVLIQLFWKHVNMT